MVHFTLELLHARNLWHLGCAARANCNNDPLEATVGGIVDNLAAVMVLVDAVDLLIEPGLLV